MPTHWIALVALVFGAAAAVAQTPAYDRSGRTVVLRYQENVGALAADEPGPSVEVYGDGRVVVRYPAYMKQAGAYTTQIAPEDVAALVEEAVGAGIVGFDRAATAAAVQQAESARTAAQKRSGKPVILSDVSDPPTTVIEATLLPEPGKRSAKTVASARWTGLARDAERFPEIETLRDLANVEKQMRGLMQRNDLRPETDL
jgi:hypothetical protein